MHEVQNDAIWVADQRDGTYINPILYADYSDPDVIRVGTDFYMVASSFNYMPGLPVLHSKDLVNWQVVSYAVERLPFENYDQPEYGKGVWAPSIRYHEGKFWVFFATPDEGIFMTTTLDPKSSWEPLTHVKKVKGWIDPCPFWDDDGKAYLVNAFAKSRIGFKSILHISSMSPDGTALLDEGRHVFDGNLHHPTIEGPKLYKRNGYYYIFAPAGGVKPGWQTVLRSRKIYGPYEDKIVLHQGDTPVNGPHQGGWVETEKGESWFIHFQDKDAYGRIIHLQPVEWINDWPLIGKDNNGDGIGEPVQRYEKPDVGESYPVVVPKTSDDFNSDKLSLQWQWNANPKESGYSLSDRKGYLRLYALSSEKSGNPLLADNQNILTQLFQGPSFTATARFDFHPEEEGDMAGLTVLGNEYAFVSIEKTNRGNQIAYTQGGEALGVRLEKELETVVVQDTQSVFFRVRVQEDALCTFSYSLNGEKYISFSSSFTATAGGWVGAKLGIFCTNRLKNNSNGYADYHWFTINLE